MWEPAATGHVNYEGSRQRGSSSEVAPLSDPKSTIMCTNSVTTHLSAYSSENDEQGEILIEDGTALESVVATSLSSESRISQNEQRNDLAAETTESVCNRSHPSISSLSTQQHYEICDTTVNAKGSIQKTSHLCVHTQDRDDITASSESLNITGSNISSSSFIVPPCPAVYDMVVSSSVLDGTSKNNDLIEELSVNPATLANSSIDLNLSLSNTKDATVLGDGIIEKGSTNVIEMNTQMQHDDTLKHNSRSFNSSDKSADRSCDHEGNPQSTIEDTTEPKESCENEKIVAGKGMVDCDSRVLSLSEDAAEVKMSFSNGKMTGEKSLTVKEICKSASRQNGNPSLSACQKDGEMGMRSSSAVSSADNESDSVSSAESGSDVKKGQSEVSFDDMPRLSPISKLDYTPVTGTHKTAGPPALAVVLERCNVTDISSLTTPEDSADIETNMENNDKKIISAAKDEPVKKKGGRPKGSKYKGFPKAGEQLGHKQVCATASPSTALKQEVEKEEKDSSDVRKRPECSRELAEQSMSEESGGKRKGGRPPLNKNNSSPKKSGYIKHIDKDGNVVYKRKYERKNPIVVNPVKRKYVRKQENSETAVIKRKYVSKTNLDGAPVKRKYVRRTDSDTPTPVKRKYTRKIDSDGPTVVKRKYTRRTDVDSSARVKRKYVRRIDSGGAAPVKRKYVRRTDSDGSAVAKRKYTRRNDSDASAPIKRKYTRRTDSDGSVSVERDSDGTVHVKRRYTRKMDSEGSVPVKRMYTRRTGLAETVPAKRKYVRKSHPLAIAVSKKSSSVSSSKAAVEGEDVNPKSVRKTKLSPFVAKRGFKQKYSTRQVSRQLRMTSGVTRRSRAASLSMQAQVTKTKLRHTLRSLDTGRSLRSQENNQNSQQTDAKNSSSSFLQKQTVPPKKVKQPKPPPESPPHNPTIPVVEVDRDAEPDCDLDIFTSEIKVERKPKPIHSFRGRRGGRGRRKLMMSEASPQTSSEAFPKVITASTPDKLLVKRGCDLKHSCCVKNAVSKTDQSTQWEDTSEWYAAIERTLNPSVLLGATYGHVVLNQDIPGTTGQQLRQLEIDQPYVVSCEQLPSVKIIQNIHNTQTVQHLLATPSDAKFTMGGKTSMPVQLLHRHAEQGSDAKFTAIRNSPVPVNLVYRQPESETDAKFTGVTNIPMQVGLLRRHMNAEIENVYGMGASGDQTAAVTEISTFAAGLHTPGSSTSAPSQMGNNQAQRVGSRQSTKKARVPAPSSTMSLNLGSEAADSRPVPIRLTHLGSSGSMPNVNTGNFIVMNENVLGRMVMFGNQELPSEEVSEIDDPSGNNAQQPEYVYID